MLLASNPSIEPEIVDPDSIAIIGKVVQIRRTFD
jgi:SOS-response transcriptional repressor LexA